MSWKPRVVSLVLYFAAFWGWPLYVGMLRLDRIQQQFILNDLSITGV